MTFNFINKFLIIIITLFICNSLFVVSSHSEEFFIENIEVKGNQRIDIETVESYSDLKIGQLYNDEIGNDSLKKLYDTDLFSDIEIEFINGTVNILVEENPTINLIKFEGNKKKDDDDLISEISLSERSIYSRSKVKKDIKKLLTLYQRSGRLSAEVVPKVETLEDNRVNLIFEINESDVVTVSKISFIGNNSFSDRDLRKIMKTKKSSIFKFFSSSNNYDPDKLDYDQVLISNFYKNSGFINFSFISSIAQLIPNRNQFEIILTIDEGDLYEVGNVEIKSELEKLNIDALMTILQIKSGELYNEEAINNGIDSIKDAASAYGYSFIKIDIDTNIDPLNKLVNIQYLINEGPKVYIDKIDINGNDRTLDNVIRRELKIAEGDSYSKYSIDSSKNSILALGFFDEVNVSETKTKDKDKINIDIDVSEKNTGEASIGAGYSSTTKANLQLGLKEKNFLGKGQMLKFSSNFGQDVTTYDISFAEPYFNGRNLYTRADVYSQFEDYGSVNYETEKLGLALSLGFPMSYDKRITLNYSIYTDTTKADASATQYERLLAGTSTISSIGHRFVSDRRNSPYKPSSGYIYKIEQDLAGLGGDSNFVKSIFKFDYYKRINKSLIGSLKIQAGHLNGYNDKYSPISSYYNLGGDKLRGFQSQRIGPRVGNSYTGGQYYYLLSTETNIDLPISDLDITSTLFVDTGSVWGVDDRFGTIDDDHKIRASTGINFMWDSAVGPINFIFSQVLKKEETDAIDKFYFDIGYNF